jgi:hypothetical protein
MCPPRSLAQPIHRLPATTTPELRLKRRHHIAHRLPLLCMSRAHDDAAFAFYIPKAPQLCFGTDRIFLPQLAQMPRATVAQFAVQDCIGQALD